MSKGQFNPGVEKKDVQNAQNIPAPNLLSNPDGRRQIREAFLKQIDTLLPTPEKNVIIENINNQFRIKEEIKASQFKTDEESENKAEEKLEKKLPDPVTTDQELSERASSPIINDIQARLAEAIQQLHLLDDALDDIKSQYVEVEIGEEGKSITHKILHRNASDLKITTPRKAHERNDSANYAIMGLNDLNAALNLFKVKNEDLTEEDKTNILAACNKFFEFIKNSRSAEQERVNFLHHFIIPFFAKKLPIPEEALFKKLKKTRNFSNFDQPNCSVATEFGIFGTRFLHIDVPMTGNISAEVIEQLNKIKTISNADLVRSWNIPWFDALDIPTKEQVKLHADNILQGKAISNRLLDVIPGVRFAGEDRIYDIKEWQIQTGLKEEQKEGAEKNRVAQGKEEPKNQEEYKEKFRAPEINKDDQKENKEARKGTKENQQDEKDKNSSEISQENVALLSHGYHCGNIAHKLKDKKSNLPATKQALEQMKTLTGKKKIVIVSLTSPPYGSRKLENQTISISKKESIESVEGFSYINAPLNGFRRFPLCGGSMGGYDETILPLVLRLLQDRTKKDKGHALTTNDLLIVNRLDDYDFSILNKSIKEIREIRNRYFEPKENDSLEIISRINKIVRIINKSEIDNIAVVYECKSGKDRTGLQRLFNFISDITDYLCQKLKSHTKEQIENETRRMLTRINPPGKQSGMAGSSLGCGGIQPNIDGYTGIADLSRATPAKWDDGHTSDIARETATYAGKLPKIATWKKIAIILAIVLGLLLCATGIGAALGVPLLGGSVAAAMALTGQVVSCVFGISLAIKGFSEVVTAPTLKGKALGALKMSIGALLTITGLGFLAQLIAGPIANLFGTVSNATITAKTTTIAYPAVASATGLMTTGIGIWGAKALGAFNKSSVNKNAYIDYLSKVKVNETGVVKQEPSQRMLGGLPPSTPPTIEPDKSPGSDSPHSRIQHIASLLQNQNKDRQDVGQAPSHGIPGDLPPSTFTPGMPYLLSDRSNPGQDNLLSKDHSLSGERPLLATEVNEPSSGAAGVAEAGDQPAQNLKAF